MMFKDGPGAYDWLRERVLAGQGGTFAVAFWGGGAIERLGLLNRPDAEPIKIICNLSMGGTNPHEVRRLMKLENVIVRQSDKLHGKSYRFEDAALIGSSNASANGLSFEGAGCAGWHEANLVTSDARALAALDVWYTTLGSCQIRNLDLIAADRKWQRRRQLDAQQDHAAHEIVRWLYEGPEAFTGRSVYLAAYTEPDLTPDGEMAAKQAIEQYGTKIDWFENWPTLPKECTLISFHIGKNGTIAHPDDIYQRRAEIDPLPIGKNGSGGELELCFKLGQRKQLVKQRSFWQPMLKWLRAYKYDAKTHEGWDSRLGAGFVDLSVVARAVNDGELKLPPLK